MKPGESRHAEPSHLEGEASLPEPRAICISQAREYGAYGERTIGYKVGLFPLSRPGFDLSYSGDCTVIPDAVVSRQKSGCNHFPVPGDGCMGPNPQIGTQSTKRRPRKRKSQNSAELSGIQCRGGEDGGVTERQKQAQ